jgi:hypothetical protein
MNWKDDPEMNTETEELVDATDEELIDIMAVAKHYADQWIDNADLHDAWSHQYNLALSILNWRGEHNIRK